LPLFCGSIPSVAPGFAKGALERLYGGKPHRTLLGKKEQRQISASTCFSTGQPRTSSMRKELFGVASRSRNTISGDHRPKIAVVALQRRKSGAIANLSQRPASPATDTDDRVTKGRNESGNP